MARSRTQKQPTGNSRFAETILSMGTRFPLFQVFSDFLTMSIAACGRNPSTGLSYDEALYLVKIATYKDSKLRFEFANAFAFLVEEMEDRVHDKNGNDVLGEFFEQHFANERTEQIFTPFHICRFMASLTHSDLESSPERKSKTLRIIDPTCGSGRMLLAASSEFGYGHDYYGIDIDQTCAQMTALNLFLNGIWHSEVLCANALVPDDFVVAYHISFLPLGIFKIEQKEESRLWHLQRNAFRSSSHTDAKKAIVSDDTSGGQQRGDDGMQLVLF